MSASSLPLLRDADTIVVSLCVLTGLRILSYLAGLSSSSLRLMGDADTIISSPCRLDGLYILSYDIVG